MVTAAPSAEPLTIVFVHGFLDDAAVWDGVVSALATPDLGTVAVDLAGMSGSVDEPGPYTLRRYAEDVTAAIDAVDGPVVLVGQSMGTQIVELAALARPEKVRGLVLLTPIPLAGAQLPADAVAPFAGLGGQPDQQRGVRLQLSANFPDEELERLTAAGARIAADAVPAFVEAWNQGVPEGQEPTRFTGPVLVLRGPADPFSSAELVSTAVAPRFPGAEVVAVADAGHWAHVEQPGVVAELLDRFVAAAVRTPAGTNTAAGVREQGWTSAFAQKTPSAFGGTFAPDVRLQAGTLLIPVEGRDAVQKVMAAASGIYESLTFTHEAAAGRRTYLEWEATAFGGVQLEGVTVLTKGDDDRIVDVAIHHRPLGAALTFSRTLGDKLDGVIPREHFFSGHITSER